MSKTCPLCHSDHTNPGRSAKVSDLVRIYAFFGINVDAEFAEERYLDLLTCQDCKCQFFNPLKSGSVDYYSQLQKQSWYYPKDKSEFEFARKFINQSDTVLEVGCGNGSFADLITCQDYLGLEFTETAINAAREKGHKVLLESLENYADKNPEKNDVVCFFQVLEHVPDVRSFLQAAVNSLKPGGLLVVSVPSADSFLSYSLNNILNMPPHHLTRWTKQSFESVASMFNLNIIAHEHELLADEHVQNYLETMMLMAISPSYKTNMPLIDISFAYKLRIRLAGFLARLLAPVMKHKVLRPNGHSITYVFQKSISA